MANNVSKPFYSALLKHGLEHQEVTVVTNDLTASCEADGFRDAFPERYVSAGMAEQALIASLSGMATEGLYPIYTSFAVFCTRRPYEQVALTLAYPARKATIVGFLPGLMTPGGVTHQALDDIGLMTGLPNMTVVEAADATDMETLLDAVYPIQGPTYVRALRGEVPRLFDAPLEIGQHRTLFEGEDVLVVVSGHLTAATQRIVSEIREENPGVGLVNVSTLKPFDDVALYEKLSRAATVITVENHWVTSGLGRIVGEVILEHGYSTRLLRVGVKDTFTHGGSPSYLENFYGIGESDIRNTILGALGREHEGSAATRTGGTVGLTEGVAEGL
ncbi:MAG: transketolase C-terminal domain-containing protein [Pontimonas sp.]